MIDLKFSLRFKSEDDAKKFVSGTSKYLQKEDPLCLCDVIDFAKEFNSFSGEPDTNCDVNKKDLGWDSSDASNIEIEKNVIVGSTYSDVGYIYIVKFPKPHEIPFIQSLKMKFIDGSSSFTLKHIINYGMDGTNTYVKIIKNDGRPVIIPISSLLYLEEI